MTPKPIIQKAVAAYAEIPSMGLNLGMISMTFVQHAQKTLFEQMKKLSEPIIPKKSYADECLERAEKSSKGLCILTDRSYVYSSYIYKGLGKFTSYPFLEGDADFINHARTDVMELARRLKLACLILRQTLKKNTDLNSQEMDECQEFINELEAPLPTHPVKEKSK